MQESISIIAINSISPLGISIQETWNSYLNNDHCMLTRNFNKNKVWVAGLSDLAKAEINALKNSDSKYEKLDNSVLYAIYTSRRAMKDAGWIASDNFGINIGSSRGATALFEKYHEDFLRSKEAQTLSSPTTTLGNISSWVAHDLQTQGPEISHSITCSTALHALLNGVAWLSSGMADKFLVGGSEASLTPFTIAQMQALKIYSRSKVTSIGMEKTYPCRALDLTKKQNSMILGEGASIACLEKGRKNSALAFIDGVGYATEILAHNTSISAEAQCFQRSMQMAIGDTNLEEIDAIVMHAPGTKKGDHSEFKAIDKVFRSNIPSLTTNKWKIGHTFGASGMLSIELAVLMMQNQRFIPVPYIDEQEPPKQIKKVLVNAVGFGGNAVSVLLSKN